MNLSNIKKALLSLCFLFIFGAGIVSAGSDVKAAEAVAPKGTVSDIRQTEAYSGSFKITFQYSQLDVKNFIIECSTDKVTWNKMSDYGSQTGTSVHNLNPASTYYVRVIPYTGTASNPILGTPSEPIEVVTAPSEKPTVIRETDAGVDSITLEWTPVAGATGYYITYYNSIGTASASTTVTANASAKTTLTKLAKNSKYTVKVRAFRQASTGFIADEKYGTSEYGLPVRPSKAYAPVLSYYWKATSGISLKTTMLDSAASYEYEADSAYGKKSKKLTTAEGSYTSCTLKHKAFSKYCALKVRVRGYIIINNKKVYGEWSDWKYLSDQPKLTVKNVKKGQKISFETIKGADRYLVFASTKQKNGYKKIATTKKSSLVVDKIKKKKLKKNKTYYYYVIPQKKLGKKYINLCEGIYCYYLKKI